MKKFLILVCLLPLMALGQESDSIIGRPYTKFDASAFCSYRDFHPSQYLTDNNWDILCAFVNPGTIESDRLMKPNQIAIHPMSVHKSDNDRKFLK